MLQNVKLISIVGLCVAATMLTGCQVVQVEDQQTKEGLFWAKVEAVNMQNESVGQMAFTDAMGGALLPSQMGEGQQFLIISKDGYVQQRVARQEGAMTVSLHKSRAPAPTR